MSKNARKVFRQQQAAVKTNFTTACPVCGSPMDDLRSTAQGWGETIEVKTRWGAKTIPRYSKSVYVPCGCTLTYDRQLQQVVEQTKGR